jgi:carbonic anhydrase
LTSKLQSPPFFYVGCCDSRLPLNTFTRSGPGHFFVHRNIANQIHHNDINLLASLEYAVNFLGVEHIIVAGHYRCGGIRASVHGVSSGVIGSWVQPIRLTYLAHRDSLDVDNEEHLLDQLSELNAVEQCKSLLGTKIMLDRIEAGQSVPTIHAAIIDLGTGHINELPLPLQQWREQKLIPQSYNNNGYEPCDITTK